MSLFNNFTNEFEREVDEIEKNYFVWCAKNKLDPDNLFFLRRYMFASITILFKEIKELNSKELARTKEKDKKK